MTMVHKPFASFHFMMICSLVPNITGISNKLLTTSLKSHWQRWKRENVTAKSVFAQQNMYTFMEGSGHEDKALFVLEPFQTGHEK